MKRSIWIGYDPREHDAYEVCLRSMILRMTVPVPARYSMSDGALAFLPDIQALDLETLGALGLYWREHERRAGQLFDLISDAPMSTEFAISRFLCPILAKRAGWAVFMDCDMLIRADLDELFKLADRRFAVQVVKHDHRPTESLKMDGQAQTAYRRKNWSSVMLWNCGHEANRALDLVAVNSLPGRDLHRFAWLPDDLIGELPPEWNHLVGVDSPNPAAKIAHFTLGVPSMAGYEDCEFADEWRALCPAP